MSDKARVATISGRATFPYNLRFPGQYYQAETGLNQNYSRDYDPLVGRYIESDPILQPTRDVIDGEWVFAVPYLLKWSRLLLPYTYVANQPTVATDPRGLIWPISLIECLYYSNKYLDAVQDCKRRAGNCTMLQLNFIAAYKAPSLSDAIFKCACQNAGHGVCANMFESCANTANGAPKMVE
jgi:RHS repeat-associated protein